WPLLVLPEDETAGRRAVSTLGEGEFRPSGLPGRGAHPGAALLLLRSISPPDHPVLSLADTSDTTLAALTDGDFVSNAWLLPSLAPAAAATAPFELAGRVPRLRPSDGCPWDREQNHLSLRKHLLEEAYEVYDALEGGP